MGDLLNATLESFMLELPQAECPVFHHFGPGIYIREVTLPAGIVAIGHAQRYEHLNIVLTGKVAIINDGEAKEISAPAIFIGKPGRKFGYVMEKCTWLNVYSTDERDIDKLEEMFLDKSDVWKAHDAANRQDHDEDRADFSRLIAAAGFTHDVVRAQSENESDQTGMPEGFDSITIRGSDIEGKGVFSGSPIAAGDLIAPARINGFRTPVGRFTNHSATPNAAFEIIGGDAWLRAVRPIAGCAGGGKGDEITVDYREGLRLAGIGTEGGRA